MTVSARRCRAPCHRFSCLGFPYWRAEWIVGKFFDTLQKQDYKSAYAIWMHDPNWAQHPGEHPKYPFNEFYQRLGTGRRMGTDQNSKGKWRRKLSGPSSGLLVDVVGQ